LRQVRFGHYSSFGSLLTANPSWCQNTKCDECDISLDLHA
jgi:hypothetical protein